ncbi:hypothetical protein AAFF_G00035540 [Aldrovandia affinis]|uniref:Uncharacterized protein n=1 Tax=Aldrovandia affinis TaxID=143900 RepID=A0AAD7WFN8_9TELE|nr:hypothetical protein AAFF_G00035540 [Aldrovandia affinis]
MRAVGTPRFPSSPTLGRGQRQTCRRGAAVSRLLIFPCRKITRLRRERRLIALEMWRDARGSRGGAVARWSGSVRNERRHRRHWQHPALSWPGGPPVTGRGYRARSPRPDKLLQMVDSVLPLQKAGCLRSDPASGPARRVAFPRVGSHLVPSV